MKKWVRVIAGTFLFFLSVFLVFLHISPYFEEPVLLNPPEDFTPLSFVDPSPPIAFNVQDTNFFNSLQNNTIEEGMGYYLGFNQTVTNNIYTNGTPVAFNALSLAPLRFDSSAPLPVPSALPFIQREEIWIAVRTDGLAGTGTQTDPFDGSTQQKFDALLRMYNLQNKENITIHLGEGTFYTAGSERWPFVTQTRGWHAWNGWTLSGASMNKTRLVLNNPYGTIVDYTSVIQGGWGDAHDILISDLTVDGNKSNYDPSLAIGCVSLSGRSNLRIERVRAVNCGGGRYEGFILHIVTDDISGVFDNGHVIQESIVENISGSWSTAINIGGNNYGGSYVSGIVRNNKVHGSSLNNYQDSGYRAGIGGWGLGNVTYYNNEIYNVDTGFIDDSLNSTGYVLRHNLFQNISGWAINIGGWGTYVAPKIIDNVITLGPVAQGIYFNGKVTNATIESNRIYRFTCTTGFVKTNETTCAPILCTSNATTACAVMEHASVTGNTNVLCVYDSNSVLSSDVCAYYLQKRPGARSLGVAITPGSVDMPWDNVIQTGEVMNSDVFRATIIAPVLAYTVDKPEITHLALAKGIPHALIDGGQRIAAVPFINNPYGAYNSSTPWYPGGNSSFPAIHLAQSANAGIHFDPELYRNVSGGYTQRFVSSHLTGFTLEDIKALIDRAQQPVPAVTSWLLDRDTDAFSVYVSDVANWQHQLLLRSIPSGKITINADESLVTAPSPVSAYFGPGTYHAGYGKKYEQISGHFSLSVAPRAIYTTLESYSGFSALPVIGDHVNFTQTLVVNAFSPTAFGGTAYSNSFAGAIGSVDEPYQSPKAEAMTYFMRNYAQGLTLAESGTWRQRSVETVFGDPLMRLSDVPLKQPVGVLCAESASCLSGVCALGTDGLTRCQQEAGSCLQLYPYGISALTNISTLCIAQNVTRCVDSQFVSVEMCNAQSQCTYTTTGQASVASCKLSNRQACTSNDVCVSGICKADLTGTMRCGSANTCVISEQAMVDAEQGWWNCVPGTGQRRQCLQGQWQAPESCATGCQYGQCVDLDTIAPTISSLSTSLLASQTYIRTQNYLFALNATDARGVTGATLTLGGRRYAGTLVSPGLFSVSLGDITLGNYTYYWTARDASNNVGTSNSSTVTILPAVPGLALLVNEQNTSLSFSEGATVRVAALLNVSKYEGTLELYHNTTLVANHTLACSSPTLYSPGPVLSIGYVQQQGQWYVNLSWMGYLGKTYQLKLASEVIGPYTTLVGPVFAGNGIVQSHLYLIPPTAGQGFFILEERDACPLDVLTIVNSTLVLDHVGNYTITARYTNGTNFLSTSVSLNLSVSSATVCTPGATLACPTLADARVVSGVNNTCTTEGQWTNVNTCQYMRQAEITLGNLTHAYDRTSKSALISTVPVGLQVNVTYNGLSALPVAGGNYTVFAQIMNESYEGNVTGRLEIRPALQSLDVSDLNFGVRGVFLERTFQASASSGLPVTFEVVSGGETFEVVTGDSLLTGNVISPLETRTGLLLRFWEWVKSYFISAEREVASVGLSPSTLSNGTRIRFIQPGNLTLRAVQAGNENYSAALPIERIIPVIPSNAELLRYINSYSSTYRHYTANYTGLPQSFVFEYAPTKINISIYYNGSLSEPTNPGYYPMVIISNDRRYLTNNLTGHLFIDKLYPAVTFTPVGILAIGQTITLQATSNAPDLPIFFEVSGPATLSGNNLTVTGPGIIEIEASTGENQFYYVGTKVHYINGNCLENQVPDQGTCKEVCTSFTYSGFGVCSEQGQQTQTVLSAVPTGCVQGNPTLTQPCTRQCTPDTRFGVCPEVVNGTSTGTSQQCNALGTAYFANSTCSLTCVTGSVKVQDTLNPGRELCVQTICTPDATTACTSMEHASVTGYANKCTAFGTGFITNNGTVENTCVYRCDPRYHSNGTACMQGNSVFTLRDVRLFREPEGLFVFPNETNTSYIVFGSTFEETRLGNLSVTIEQEDEREAFVIVRNVSLRGDEVKTIILKTKRTRSNAVCIADRSDIVNHSDIERRCFVLACPGVNGSYTCEKLDDRFLISGLRHSGVIETRIVQVTNDTFVALPPSSPSPLFSSNRTSWATTPNFNASGVAPYTPSIISADSNSSYTPPRAPQQSAIERLADTIAGGNQTLLFIEIGSFVFIVLLLIIVLVAWQHFARQQSGS